MTICIDIRFLSMPFFLPERWINFPKVDVVVDQLSESCCHIEVSKLDAPFAAKGTNKFAD